MIYYAGAASRRAGSQAATSTFPLDKNNKAATDLVTNGSTIWVVNDGSSSDSVFVYSTAGSLLGKWNVDSANSKSTGIAIDPTGTGNILIVDSKADLIYQYDASLSVRSGKLSASKSIALDANNGNAQAIAVVPADAKPATTSTAMSPKVDVRDVNEDGRVSPTDALLVLNHLNDKLHSNWQSSPWLLDVNNDNHVSPVDALKIVNLLAKSKATGEGERSAQDSALLELVSDLNNLDDDMLHHLSRSWRR